MKTKNYKTTLLRLAMMLALAVMTSTSAMAQVPFSLSTDTPNLSYLQP